VKLKHYFPDLPKLSQEVIAVLAATVIAAWIISRSPTLRELVRQNSPPGPFNP